MLLVRTTESFKNQALRGSVHETMSAIERKEQTERLLKAWKIPVHTNLPAFEEEQEINAREPHEIAIRVMILTYLNCVCQAPEAREAILAFLEEEGLWRFATETEKDLFQRSNWTEQEETNTLWRSESIWLLLWAIEQVEHLAWPLQEANMNDIISLLPPFLSNSRDFVSTVNVRSTPTLLDMADLLFRLNWASMQAEKEGRPLDLHPGILYERHQAINWVLRIREEWE